VQFVAKPFNYLLPCGSIFSCSFVGLGAPVGIGIAATIRVFEFFFISHRIAKGRNRLGIHGGHDTEVWELLFQLVDQSVEDVSQHFLVVGDEFQETLHGIIAGCRGHSSKRIETAKLSQLTVAPKFPDDSCRGRMLKHYPSNDHIPHGTYGIVVSSSPATLLQVADQFLIGKRI